ncbi:hypothetical protein PFISCL1PPCAC_25632 [Pristionchus fissidentatus]|uniref:LisH domain-containing protein n=1 Tax=Pristionchus fissidentatus TaxID=1538716 RepID=A0AAV5WUU2_9BILA|nr:hypothetical protein PFISCL1PPCAC_25632 [Pristionchus fissidentatus]
MSFSAAELNFLVLRYLEESGMQHTAFLFSKESQMDPNEALNREVPTGALVHVVQKGLSFVEFESKAGIEDAGGNSADCPRLGLLDAVSDETTRQRVRERMGTNDGAGTSGQTQRDREARADRMGAGGGMPGGAGTTTNGGSTHGTPRRDRSAHPQQPGLSPTNSVSSQSGSGPGRGGTPIHGMGVGGPDR